MEQRHKNEGGNRNSRQPRNPNFSKEKKPTFGELAEKVKNDFFQKTEEVKFEELLNMSKTQYLDKVLDKIEEIVQKEGKNLSTSQLRNIYDKTKKEKTANGLKLLRPNLAYIAGRSSNDKEKSLLAFIDLLIKSIDSEEMVQEFHIFFEAVVAYHKFYGKQ